MTGGQFGQNSVRTFGGKLFFKLGHGRAKTYDHPAPEKWDLRPTLRPDELSANLRPVGLTRLWPLRRQTKSRLWPAYDRPPLLCNTILLYVVSSFDNIHHHYYLYINGVRRQIILSAPTVLPHISFLFLRVMLLVELLSTSELWMLWRPSNTASCHE